MGIGAEIVRSYLSHSRIALRMLFWILNESNLVKCQEENKKDFLEEG